MDNKVHIYELQGNNLNHIQELDHLGAVTDVSYSPDDNYLVACDAHRKVVLYNTEDYKVIYDFLCPVKPQLKNLIVYLICDRC